MSETHDAPDDAPDNGSPEAVAAPVPAEAPPRAGWLAPLLLVLVSIGLYLPARNHLLVYDDVFLVINNSNMMALDGAPFTDTFQVFAKEYWDGVNPDRPDALRTRGQALYRPLTVWIFAVIRWFHGVATAWPYHLVNFLLNAAVVATLYVLSVRLFRSRWVAFAASLLYAVHPLHTEAVTYIAGLSDLLAALSVLLGLLFWEKAVRNPSGLRTGPWLALLATFFLGLLAKEQAVVLIAAIALTEIAFAASGRRWAGGLARLMVYGGLLVMLAIHVAIRLQVLPSLKPSADAISVMDNPLIKEGFGIRLINGVKLIAMEFWLALYPKDLSIDYSFNAIPVSRSWTQAEPLAAGVLLLVLLVWGFVMLRRRPALGWGLLFFTGTAAFTANILLPIGTIFGERLAYLPTAGLALAAASLVGGLCGATKPGGGGKLAWVGMAAVVAVSGVLSWRTVERNRDYRDSIVLFEKAAEVVPQSCRVQYQIGSLYAQQQLWTAAEEAFTKALKIDDTMIQAAIGLADVYNGSKNADKAIEIYDRILQQMKKPDAGEAQTVAEIRRMVHLRRGMARSQKGDAAGALEDFRVASEGGGSDNNTVSAQLALARLLVQSGKPAEAIPVLRQANLMAPRNANILNELARAAHAANDDESFRQAIDGLKQTRSGRTFALALEAETLYDEGVREGDESKRQQALAEFDEVRSAAPQDPTPYIYRARFLLEKGRPADALPELELALDRAPRQPRALLFKAFALNALSRYDEALAVAKDLATIQPDADCYTAMFSAAAASGQTEDMEAAFAKLKELGAAPVQVIVDRAAALRDAGRVEDAITAIETARLIPENHDQPILLRNLGILLIEAGRYDEALAAFQAQEAAELLDPEGSTDPFLPVNRARCYMGLGRTMDAAAQLEIFEAAVPKDSVDYVSLLHRRAELFLLPGPLEDPARAADLAEEGLQRVHFAYPDLLAVSIEALVARGDVPAALARATDAHARYPDDKRFGPAERALKLVRDGQLEAARDALRKGDDPWLAKLSSRLPAG